MRALARAPLALLEGPGGYGKSVLAAELRAHLDMASALAVVERDSDSTGAILGVLRRGLRDAGLSDLAARVGTQGSASLIDAIAHTSEPMLLIVDEVQRATGEALELIAELAGGLPHRHHMLIVGRRLAPRLAKLSEELEAPRIGADALAFDDAELETLLTLALSRPPEPTHVADLRRSTMGWPAAAALAATSLARGSLGPAGDTGSLTDLLDDLLAGVDPDDLRRITWLAHLPLLSEPIADACAGTGALRLLRDAGLPLRAGRAGWLELPDPVREELSRRSTLPARAARAAAEALADAHELPSAMALLAQAGDDDGLAALLANRRWQELATLELSEILAVIESLPASVLARHPFALVQAARIAGSETGLEARRRLLDRALTAVESGRERHEAEAELAAALAEIEPDEEVEHRAQAVLAEAGPEERVARSRALRALGRVEAWRRDPGSMIAAESHLSEAAALCGLAGEREWQASTLAELGYRVAYARGDLERAAAHMSEGLALLPEPTKQRASVAGFAGEVLLYLGRLDQAEATLNESLQIGRTLGDHRIQAYASWTWSRLASLRGDAAATIQRIRQTERHPGDWFEHPTGIEFLADCAVALARVGERDLAVHYAERARVRAEAVGYPEIAWGATGVVEARFGDPTVAEQAMCLYAESPQQPVRDEWHTLLVRAYAALRRGEEGMASMLAAQAYEAAAALGYPELPALHEPELSAALATLAADAGSRAAAAATARPRTFVVTLLGGFAVSADGQTLEPPPGLPSTLVKLVALAGGPLPLDEAAESLWRDADTVTGRRRLRNVLGRLRSSCGELVVRSSNALTLAPGTETDLDRFQAAAEAGFKAPPESRMGLARIALAQYGGELLPEDRYEPWTTDARERATNWQLELLDLLARDAAERGDLDEAIRRLDQAAAVEPLDESRYARAAELLLFQGRRGSARSRVEHALRIRAQAGLPDSPQLKRLRDATAVDAGSGAAAVA